MKFKILPIVLLASSLIIVTVPSTAASTPNPNLIIDYSQISTGISTPGFRYIYATLDNGFSLYPPSVICIDGQAVFESSSGSGMFDTGSLLDPSLAPNEVWIPYFGSACAPRSTQDSSFFATLNEDQSLSVNAKIVNKSSGGVTITYINAQKPTTAPEIKNESGNTQQVIQQVVNPETPKSTDDENVPEFIVYALKSTSISTGKPIPLDARLTISRTSVPRNRSVNITLSDVVRLDPKFKDASCELITSRNTSTAVATAKLDESGKCVISWTPGSSYRRGRINAFVRIIDSSRDHTYITNNFNLNIT